MYRLVSSLLGIVFVLALLGLVSASRLVHEHPRQGEAKIAPVVPSLVSGSLLARREPFKSFPSTPPVLRFPFLFNLTAGVLVAVFALGSRGIGTATGLIAVSPGAGTGFALGRKRPIEADHPPAAASYGAG